MTDPIITAHLSAHHAWQGPRSEAPAWALRLVDGAPRAAISGEAATRAAGGQVGGFRHIANPEEGRGLDGPSAASVDVVNHPPHYAAVAACPDCGSAIEAITITEQHGFAVGNALKYILRAGRKEGASRDTDLRKARWYLDREIAGGAQ